MILYLVRHGPAVDVGECNVVRDQDRMLSVDGLRRTREAARGLRNLEVAVERVVSSPLVRARQTAEIMAQILHPKLEVEIEDGLASGSDMRALLPWLAAQPQVATMLVGHMPDLSLLAALLLTNRDDAAIRFKKCATARFVFEAAARPRQGELEWLLQPAVLKSLA